MSDKKFNNYTKELITQGQFNYGVYNTKIESINMLNAQKVWNKFVPNWFKKFRLKEWEAFQLWTCDYFIFGAVYDAKVLGISLLSVYHIPTGAIWHNKKIVSSFSIKVAKGLNSTKTKYNSKQLSLFFVNELNENRVTINAHSNLADVKLNVSCYHKAEPMVVCLPLGNNRAMYSHKILMPVSGDLSVNGELINLNVQNAQCIIDDHKGFYPYNLSYDWATASWRNNGVLYGFNLTRNQATDPHVYNENCIWIDNKLYRLPYVEFDFFDNPNKWVIQSTDKSVYLEFYPSQLNPINVNLALISVDYQGPYGKFTGTIKLSDSLIEVSEAFGMGEIKRNRM